MAGYLCVRLELRVELADSTPIPNFSVQLDTPALADSGGHSHDGNRPMGRYIVPKVTGTGVDTIASGIRKTDSTGVLKFKFLASQFDGVERIRAQLADDTTKWDTLSLKTQVPGLQLLPDGTNYDLVGGTCKHHGPSDDPGVPAACRTPDNNHYAAKIVRDSLALMANEWVDSLGNIGLFVNDISLPFGGLFDHKGTWAPPHSTHRQGLDVDIRTELLSLNPPRQGVRVRDSQGNTVGNREFENVARRFGVRFPNIHLEGTDNEHYHLYY